MGHQANLFWRKDKAFGSADRDIPANDDEITVESFGITQGNRIALRQRLYLDRVFSDSVLTIDHDVDAPCISGRRHYVPAETGQPITHIVQADVPDSL